MKFGIFLLMQSPDMLPSTKVYENALEQARLADELGFDYVVLAEHHFSNYGFDPNPLMLVPAMAAQTERVRFSTAVVVLPLRHPLQVAEDIAMLDVLTNGRIEVGFGTGYQQYEFERFRVPLDQNRAIFEEGLEVVIKALSQPGFSHEGRYYHIPETTILPRPVQQPHPPFWRATSSVETMAQALRNGMKVISGGTTSTMARVVGSWHAFQDAVDQSGLDWPQEFIVQRGVYVAESEREAREQVRQGVWHIRTAEALRRNELPVDHGRAMTPTADVGEVADLDFLYDEWLFGTPDSVMAKIERLTHETGMTYLNCAFAVGQIPQEKILQSMRLFAYEIMPRFRDYEPDQSLYPRGEHWLVGAGAATARSTEELHGHPG
jgi:alkanesulfonate monooxygenase SsuD/methylene tetrahydromethanopterin reductase-like flavin-dependent oxidoreductase (luciferase family)